MPQKNKPQNPLGFPTNANPGAEYEKQENGTWREIPHFTLFIFRAHFRIFRDKCIAGLTICNRLNFMMALFSSW